MTTIIGDPLLAYGLLVSAVNGSEVAHGTCFGFGSPDTFLTARHCIESVTDLHVAQQPRDTQRDHMRRVVEIMPHDTADIAVLRVEPDPDIAHYYFTEIASSKQLVVGQEVHAYGYPANDPGDTALTTPRYFRGYYQRYIGNYRAPGGYTYLAGELSFPAPPGLSGAAVYRPKRRLFTVLDALVTGNIEVTRGAGYEEEIDRRPDGTVRTIQRVQVTSYAIALILGEYVDWLGQVCPINNESQ